MKRKISILTAMVLAISITACSNSGGVTANGDKSPSSSSETVAVGTDISGEITVSCFDPMTTQPFLEEAAKLFEAEYPGTKVNVESFGVMPEVKTQEENGMKMQIMTKGDDSQAQSDYINKVNTELMGGKGADVLAMDVLPFYKYAANGQLENLKTYMDTDSGFNKDDYRANILEAVSSENGQFIFPIDYTFDYFAFDSSLFSESEQAALQSAESISYEKLIEMGKAAFDLANSNSQEAIPMFGLTAGVRQNPNIFSELLDESYSSFVDMDAKKANFTDGAFVNLLNSINEYDAKGYLKQGMGGPREAGSGQMSPEMMIGNKDEQYLFKPKNSMSLMSEFNKGNMRRMIASAATGDDKNDKIAGIAENKKGEVQFSFNQAYGINSNSSNKQLAWEFIKFLGSEQVQASPQLMGLPININAFLEATKMDIAGELYEPENAGKELDADGKAIFDAYVSAVEKYTSLANTYNAKDSTINNIINTEVRGFFEGTKTADEVAEIIQNKVSLYLNE